MEVGAVRVSLGKFGGVGAVLRKGGFALGCVQVVVYARDGEFGVVEYKLEFEGAAMYESSGDGWIWTVAQK